MQPSDKHTQASAPDTADSALLDRADVRIQPQELGIGGAIKGFFSRVRDGDLGSLPVIIGLIVVWLILQLASPVFLSSYNLVNLLFDSSAVGMIALGVVMTLMLGEIDLSVGSLSGFASAVLGVLWVSHGWPVIPAIALAILCCALMGVIYAFLLNHFTMPSFVSTLAGLLSVLGMQLYLLDSTGSINLPFESPLVKFGQVYMMPNWLAYGLALIAAIGLFISGKTKAKQRQKAGLSRRSTSFLLTRSFTLLIVLELIVYYLNTDRGIPWMFGFFIAMIISMNYALTRTRWGRSMMAVGGNLEAARRAGIHVRGIRTSAFVLCAVFSAMGGLMAAARLASSSQSAGAGDVNLNAIAAAVIGGASLFGGRGNAYSALLGIIVIQSIANGLTLLNMSSALRYMITGAVLAAAVIIDSLSRRSRASHGRA